MNEKSIKSEDFDEGIKLFVEILKAQPNFLSRTVAEPDGKALAKMAAAFAVELNALKGQHSDD